MILPVITDQQLPYVLLIGCLVGASVGAGFAVAAVLAVDRIIRRFDRKPIEWEGVDE